MWHIAKAKPELVKSNYTKGKRPLHEGKVFVNLLPAPLLAHVSNKGEGVHVCLVALNLTNMATDENIVNYKWVA